MRIKYLKDIICKKSLDELIIYIYMNLKTCIIQNKISRSLLERKILTKS